MTGLLLSVASMAQDQPTASSIDPNQPVAVAAEESSTDTTQAEPHEDADPFNLKASSLLLIRETYERILTPELITEDGLVDYATLRRKRNDVMTAARELETVNPAVLMSLSKEDRIAFWINTYNVCMIKLIIDRYPIEAKWYRITYPDDSIMQIPGAWTKVYFNIQKLEYNLKEIEQDFLLQRYQDPRICFTLSYASLGGASLRNEPYTSSRLDEQLNDQVKRFLRSPKGMQLDKLNNVLHLSNIFQIHKETFLQSPFAKVLKFRNRKPEERAWLNFVLPYLSEDDARFIEKNDISIEFLPYDWHLNQKK